MSITRAEAIEKAAMALLAVVDARDEGLRGYYIDASRFDALRAALAAPLPAPGGGEAGVVARNAAMVDEVARELWDIVETHPGWKGAPIRPRKWEECEPWFVPIQQDLARHVLGMIAHPSTPAPLAGPERAVVEAAVVLRAEWAMGREPGRMAALVALVNAVDALGVTQEALETPRPAAPAALDASGKEPRS